MSDMDKVITQIEQLLRMTEENGCTEAEAQNAAARVQKLLLKHNLDMSAIQSSPQAPEVESTTEEFAEPHRGAWKWQTHIGIQVAKNMSCKCLIEKPQRETAHQWGSEGKLYFIGNPTNLKACVALHNFLIKQMIFLAMTAKTSANGSGGKTFLNAYLTGMSHRVICRLREDFAQAVKETVTESEQDGSGNTMDKVRNTMMVLADKNDEYVTRVWGGTRGIPIGQSASQNREAYQQGYGDGSKVQIHKRPELGE